MPKRKAKSPQSNGQPANNHVEETASKYTNKELLAEIAKLKRLCKRPFRDMLTFAELSMRLYVRDAMVEHRGRARKQNSRRAEISRLVAEEGKEFADIASDPKFVDKFGSITATAVKKEYYRHLAELRLEKARDDTEQLFRQCPLAFLGLMLEEMGVESKELELMDALDRDLRRQPGEMQDLADFWATLPQLIKSESPNWK